MGNKIKPSVGVKPPSQIEKLRQRLKGRNHEELFDDIAVLPPGMWDNQQSDALEGWFAVTTDEGIIAYFGDETDAYRFRWDLINLVLNG